MLPFLSCLSFQPENPDSDIFRHCQNLDLPDSKFAQFVNKNILRSCDVH